jgi:prevent-host-death family protein
MKLHEATLVLVKQVGLRELKNRLSEYVRAVRRGEHVQVTDRGQVVAELVPPMARSRGGLEARLAELERRGLLRRSIASGRAVYPRLPRIAPPGTAQRLLDEERGGR